LSEFLTADPEVLGLIPGAVAVGLEWDLLSHMRIMRSYLKEK
jgi:hypothetical protein